MTKIILTVVALTALFFLPSAEVAAVPGEPPALPNPIATPGAADPLATRDVVCNGRTRDRRHVTAAMKAAAFDAYNIPRAEASFYEVDHLIPLAIGGANALANLWPQPWPEADQKDVLEVDLQRRVCLGFLDQAQAQREVAYDWTAAYTRYVGGVPLAAPGYDGPVASAAPSPRIGIKARLKAEAWRLARRWIFGER